MTPARPYRLSVGLRKALWSLLYLVASAAVDALLKGIADIPDLQSWVVYPVVVGLLTLAGNRLKYRRKLAVPG